MSLADVTLICFSVFHSMKLLQNVTSTVNQVCKRLKQEDPNSTTSSSNGAGGVQAAGNATSTSWRKKIIKSGRLNPNSVHAVKNTRRKMEDRHVVIHDLNTIYSPSSPSAQQSPQTTDADLQTQTAENNQQVQSNHASGPMQYRDSGLDHER